MKTLETDQELLKEFQQYQKEQLKKLFIDTELLNFHRYSTFIEKRSNSIRNYISETLEIRESDYKDETVESK